MAGTITAGTLSDGTNSTSTTNCIQGSAKAWVNFNGSPASPTISASYNVSSITKNGTDDYTVTFTNAFVDNKYVANVNAGGGNTWPGAASMNWTASATISAPTSSTMRFSFITYNASGSLAPTYVYMSCFR